MRKKLILFLTIFEVCCAVFFISCKKGHTNIHEHQFDDKWSTSASSHWHKAICSHTDILKDLDDHIWQNGVCTVCQFNALILSEDGKTVVGIIDKNVTSFTFASTINAIGPSAFQGCKMTEIDIPEGIKSIDKNAFNSCVNLTRISIPQSVTSISDNAFSNCTSLTSIVIPDSVTQLGYNLFKNCSALVSIKLSGGREALDEGMFSGCTALTTLELSEGVKKLNRYLFNGCVSLTTIVIPKSLTHIENNVFDDTSLTEVLYKGSQEDWKKLSILTYSSLKIYKATIYYYSETQPEDDGEFWHYVDNDVVIWHKHTFSDQWSFDASNHWHEATCEHILKKSGFEEHDFIENAELDAGTQYICQTCGYIEIRASKYKVSEETFNTLLRTSHVYKTTIYGNDNNTNFEFSRNTVKMLYSDETFRYYTIENRKYYTYYLDEWSLDWIKEEITQDIYYKKIEGYDYFKDLASEFSSFTYDLNDKCYKVSTITIDESLFDDVVCRFEDGKLMEITFKMNEISYAYSDFDNLEVTIPENIHYHTYSTVWSSDGDYHWHNAECDHSEYYIDKSNHIVENGICTICNYQVLELSSDGKKVVRFHSNTLTTITIPSGVTTIGCGAFSDTNIKEIIIPEGVETIDIYAFDGCKNLEHIILPNTLESIKMCAFKECVKLKSIALPLSLELIHSDVFANCTGLTSLAIPDTLASYSFDAISNCTSLTFLQLPGSVTHLNSLYLEGCPNLKELVLSEGTFTIQDETFKGLSNLTTIYLPKSLTKIVNNAFANCKIEKVYYRGSKLDWENISIGEGSLSYFDDSNLYYYSETEPDDSFPSGNYWYVDSNGEVATKHIHSFSSE